jgi:dihydrofolate reductase
MEDSVGRPARIIWLINATLDGRCDHRTVIADDDLHAHATSTLAKAEVILYGRGTYELVVPYWLEVAATASGSDAENDFATTLVRKKRIVFSSSLTKDNTSDRVVSGDAVSEVRHLQAVTGGTIVLQASPQLAHSLLEAGLIDECRFVVQPLVRSTGPMLFDPGGPDLDFSLESTKPLRSGAVAIHYARR